MNNKPVTPALAKTMKKDIVPYVMNELNYYSVNGLSKVEPNHLIYELPYYEEIQNFFDQHGLTINGLSSSGIAGEADLVIMPKDLEKKHVQFCQLKFRNTTKAISTEIGGSIKKYEKTDWCIFITMDQLLIEQKIYDNPYDYENRKCIEKIRYQHMLQNYYENNIGRPMKKLNIEYNKDEIEHIQNKIRTQNDVLNHQHKKLAEKENTELKKK